jgi:16S rRNA (cytidine1402-2'-O)-methyltransferase
MPGYHIGAHAYEAASLAPGLYLVATPIGNLADVTLRALNTLAACDTIYCEDTRITSRLLERYAIKTPLRNYHEHNAEKARPQILAHLQDGKSLALVSDAGTPMISDPGFKLVEAVIAEGLTVTAVPGASAVLSGLQLSGIATDRFCFMGFLPEKKTQRRKLLETLRQSRMTTVFYESPHRICDALEDVTEILQGRQVATAREITKLHEEVLRGTASEVRASLMQRPSIKGEFVLVVDAAPEDRPVDESEIEAAVAEALETMSASKAAAHVAKALNLARDEIYVRILRRKDHGAA